MAAVGSPWLLTGLGDQLLRPVDLRFARDPS
jgi:hypothetical protein